ncbi:MAG: hypothetical protein QW165_00685 [Candidatus Woesearchaeota archaeon]
MDDKKTILLRSLLLTILIFTTGILINHVFDVFRISIIEDVMIAHEIDTEAYRVEQFFTETFGGEHCEIMVSRIADLKQEIRKVGEDLGSYSRFSFFRKKDYDYLKRKYFLLELRFLALIEKLNRECDKPYLPIIFFYEIDQDESERQGFILQDLSKDYEQQLIVLTLDKDYKDEPLVNVLVKNYNVTESPTLIIDGIPQTGLVYTGVLNASIQKFIRRADPYAQSIDFLYTPKAAGIDIQRLIAQLKEIAENETASNWARGDATLIIGRLTKNDTLICEALAYYDQINSTNPEEMALVYETSASLGCGRNRAAFLSAAAKEWKKAGNTYRADLMDKLARGTRPRIIFDKHATFANATVISGYKTPIAPILPKKTANGVIIGKTAIMLPAGSIVLSQEDRVHRDWLGGQLASPWGPDILLTFSERLTWDESELLPEIGWHEGGRIKDLAEANITHIPAVGTLVARSGERWFAVDDTGTFRFEVPLDKLSYPTTRFIRRDLAVIIDTHGVNMLVEQAIRHNVSAVVSDCDHPGKVYAAAYLSQHGIPVACIPDKYVYLAIGHNLSLAGSPPITILGNKATIGNRPIKITKADKIVVANSTDTAYALWYYQAPASYFETIARAAPLNVAYVSMSEFGQQNKITDKAREINANIIATRVFNKDDYETIKQWLDERPNGKVILFHSASYPYGQKIFREYPTRSSFDDPNPVFI